MSRYSGQNGYKFLVKDQEALLPVLRSQVTFHQNLCCRQPSPAPAWFLEAEAPSTTSDYMNN